MVIDELSLDLLGHIVKRVEGSLKITFKSGASLNDSLHNLVALLVADTGSKRESSDISSNSDSSRLDESGTFSTERRAVELGVVHVGDVAVRRSMTMVIHDDLIKELLEGEVGVLGTSVDTDAGVEVLAAREDALLEGDSSGITLVLVLVPDVLGQMLAQERGGALRELRPADKIVRGGKVGTNDGSTVLHSVGARKFSFSRVITTHCLLSLCFV